MANYSIMADLGNGIVKLLRKGLCPEPVQTPESILLCPSFEKGDYVLGVHLYDIQEDGDYPRLEMISLSENARRFPPMAVTLFYMLTVNSQAHISSRSVDEQRILGRVMQVLHDNPVFEISHIQPGAEVSDEVISLSPNFLSFEDKSRLWSSSGQGGTSRLALYYKAAPVLIDSTRVSHPSRVKEIGLNIHGKELGNGLPY